MSQTHAEFLEEFKIDLKCKSEIFKETRDSEFVECKEFYDCRIRLCNYLIRRIEQFQAEQNQIEITKLELYKKKLEVEAEILEIQKQVNNDAKNM